ncbi:MAG: Cof-type HAD-IIB family hydrolase [Anaerolineae bacterium]|nr:Cof-type HAD-IIB family hydrolase [Anaerolineae bacterium]
MSNYELLVLDVDGTLIGHGAFPSPRVTQAIKAAKDVGVTVALGTGRASEACYHLFRHLELEGLHIVFDGAAVVEWPSNDIIFLQALPPRAMKRLIALAREHDLFLEIYAHDFYFIERDGELADHQREKLQINSLVTDLMSLVDRVKVVKGQLLAANPDEKCRADLITQELGSFCKMSWSLDPSNGIYFGNAVARTVSKAGALLELVDYLDIDISKTLAIGDSYNDLGIFKVAGAKVAMGHAPDSLKGLADWIAPVVDDDGVAAAIERFIL